MALRGAAAHCAGLAFSNDEDDEQCWQVPLTDRHSPGQQHSHSHHLQGQRDAVKSKRKSRQSGRKVRHGRTEKNAAPLLFCKMFTGLMLCFVGPFLLCFLYVVLYVVPTFPESTAAAASKTSPTLSNPANVEWHDHPLIDRGATYGGKRPVLPSDLRLDTLQCPGLTMEQSQEMVYWQKIDSDRRYTSPCYQKYSHNRTQQYLTFKPDGGGFNNIRMSLETVLALAHATGRTLVMPPAHEMYLLYDAESHQQTQQQHQFGFSDFFPVETMAAQQQGLDVITMQEFLEREGWSGNLRDHQTGKVIWPPHHNRTDWNGDTEAQAAELWPYLEQVSYLPDWNPDECVIVFDDTTDATSAAKLQSQFQDELDRGVIPPAQQYVDHPTSVFGDTMDRLAEIINGRRNLCLYQHQVTQESFLHMHGRVKWGGRLLVPFYSYVFATDWRRALWTKRWVRDQVRYTDDLQCAAARVVAAVRARVRARQSDPTGGLFSAFHVRRGEFQYKRTRVSAAELYNMSQPEIPMGSTVYVATDERDQYFFRDLAEHYDLVFLDDFVHLLEGVNTNYFGMIDQLVASKAEIFFGCWFST